ncbi:MAG: 3-phosphoserine/phosphohydroxythreonine transaminase [Alphaproteobacteria bacterium]|nr:3-phosphoserine/phosphohydroxythreonine transaminase [Alphaproteobacteria bacterium]MCB9695271.1 3-phosphoserine/phosphohydroxythreonine transaminase [Alphaproteobacteria bacterium]
MSRIHNFSAGPGVLPEVVLKQAQQDLWDVSESGIGVCEHSHRGKVFDAIHQSAKARIKRLLRVDDATHEVLFLQGGARSQFYMLPMNLLRGGRATYLDTGHWAHLALQDAKRYGTVDVGWSSKPSRYDHVPAQGEWGAIPEGTAYFHYTSNNTIFGTEMSYVPDVGDVPLICDMSSNFLSRPVDGSKFAMIYAGAQKNIGPSGVTVVAVRRDLLGRMETELPAMLRYAKQVEKDSMLNTPCTFGIYAIDQVARWLEEDVGGLEVMDRRNEAQASRLYAEIDRSGFWRSKVRTDSRSRMNVIFTTDDPDRDAAFLKGASERQMSGLKGHRELGGLRASLYNAQTDAAVDALIEWMREFERTQG